MMRLVAFRPRPAGFGPALLAVGLLGLAGCSVLGPKPAWQLPPPPPAEGPVVAHSDLHRATLENGLTILVLEDRRLPSAAIGIELRQGAGSVDPARAGVAELAAEVMQRGAGDRDALALAEVVEEKGASLSVHVGWDTAGITLGGLSEDLDLFFEILGDVALRPRFEAGEFAKARAEALAGLEAAKDEPATLVIWNAIRALYPEHRYGRPLSGTAETLAGLDVREARRFWTDRFVPRNAILWAVGDVAAERVVAEAQRRFGGLPDRDPPPHTPPAPSPTPAARRVIVVDKPELGQARILLAHEGISRTEPERIAIDLMNDALGGSGFSSRLMQTVRSDAGLTYGIGSGFSLRREPGPFSVSTFTRVPEVRRVIDLVLAELRAIAGEKPIDEDELRRFISYNVGRFGLSLETSRAVLRSLVDLEVFGLPEDSLDTFRSRVRSVDTRDVLRAARERLHPERAAIVVLGPAEAIVPQLEDLGDVEVWQP